MQHKKAGREIKFPARFHEDRICNLLAAQIFYIFGSKNNGIQLAGVLLPVGLHEEQNNESDRHVCYQGHPTCEVQGQGEAITTHTETIMPTKRNQLPKGAR